MLSVTNWVTKTHMHIQHCCPENRSPHSQPLSSAVRPSDALQIQQHRTSHPLHRHLSVLLSGPSFSTPRCRTVLWQEPDIRSRSRPKVGDSLVPEHVFALLCSAVLYFIYWYWSVLFFDDLCKGYCWVLLWCD